MDRPRGQQAPGLLGTPPSTMTSHSPMSRPSNEGVGHRELTLPSTVTEIRVAASKGAQANNHCGRGLGSACRPPAYASILMPTAGFPKSADVIRIHVSGGWHIHDLPTGSSWALRTRRNP
jgi:hypothetical protein